ncbi:MAG TPA: hypothetical protein VHZ28_04805 [Terracidiphilus sp.]|nr:hypothetical protein [Terracidiphilus sp.]
MRITKAVFLATFLSQVAFCTAQQAAAAGQTAVPQTASVGSPIPTAPAAPAPPIAMPSSLLQSSLDGIQHTLAGIKVDRWKRGSVRDEANADISSLTVDLQQRMPALLKDADAAPGVLSKTLPVSRHLDALYDVLLRVVEASRMAAPDDQANTLRQSLENLEKARLALDDSMEQSASSQEKQLVDLRGTVQRQAAFKCPAPPPAPECPKPAARKPVRKKPAATPAPGTPPNAQPAPANGTQQKPAASKPATPPPQKPQ